MPYTISNATTTVGSGTATAEVFDVDLSSQPGGVYTISVSDGFSTYGKHVQVAHECLNRLSFNKKDTQPVSFLFSLQ